MKRSIWVTAAGFLALSTFSAPLSRAADHRDWPGYTNDISADITDVYAWMSADGTKVYLALDVQGANTGPTAATKFSDAVQYNIRVNSSAAFSTTAIGAKPDNILCKFDNATPQNFECWGPGAAGSATEYVKDAVGNTAGKSSKSGKMKVFAGPRDDPFYFNIRGFVAAGGAVHNEAIKTGAGMLNLDLSGCPMNYPAGFTAAAVGVLKNNGGTGAGTDDFGKNGLSLLPPGTGGMTNGNILAIVVAIDKSLLTTGGNMISVWASTNR